MDNWRHRAGNMRCKTCIYFVPKEKSTLDQPVESPTKGPMMTCKAYDLGRCRRHAPTMNGWPAVFVNDWCGDHKLDEEKI